MSCKNIPNNGVKEAGISCKGLSFNSIRMQGQVLGSCNQATTNKTLSNRNNEYNVMVLGEEEWDDLIGNCMEITSFIGFSCESSNENVNYNKKERQTWTKTLSTAVMECYFLSRPVDEEGKPVRGYRRKIHNIWTERYDTKITEQHLCDQARMITKNEWITKLEFQNNRRKVL